MSWRFCGFLSLSLLLSGAAMGDTTWRPLPDCPPEAELHRLAEADTLNPVRPGGVDGQPFWNGNALQFMYVPSFDFPAVPQAQKYRFLITDAEKKSHSFEADSPTALLSPVWAALPVGATTLKVEALDADGNVVGQAGEREFYRAAVFRGGYHAPQYEYGESARLAMDYWYRTKAFQYWLENGKPDPDYELYCYPSKMIAAVISSMVVYAELEPRERANALAIAEAAADYLIDQSEKASAPVPFFPPTYAEKDIRPTKAYFGQIMMIYPARVGMAYLNLYDVVGKQKYLDAALRIADTYRKLQLPNGSWFLKVYASSGEKVEDNICIPNDIILFLNRLEQQYAIKEYRDCNDQAFAYIMNGPVKNFNWEAQFEDVRPRPPYERHSKYGACQFAQLLLRKYSDQPEYVALARELLRFAEDQFVIWEKQLPQPQWNSDTWVTPCVLEQYGYYMPIDASASIMMDAYMDMYEVSGNILDLAKACELANAVTVAQHPESKRYPTEWRTLDRAHYDGGWLNCSAATAERMMRLSHLLKERGKVAAAEE